MNSVNLHCGQSLFTLENGYYGLKHAWCASGLFSLYLSFFLVNMVEIYFHVFVFLELVQI